MRFSKTKSDVETKKTIVKKRERVTDGEMLSDIKKKIDIDRVKVISV